MAITYQWRGEFNRIQDVMVAKDARHQRIGTGLVAAARDGARRAGCEWLHVDFENDLRAFYFDECGFTPTNAGQLALRSDDLDGAPRDAFGVEDAGEDSG